MTKAEILDRVVAVYAHKNYAAFARLLEMPYSTVTSWKYRDNNLPVEIISAKCADINIEFLLYGKEPVVLPKDAKKQSIDKITQATNELLLACSELKKQIADIRQELEEERRQHRETTALLNRVLDLYTQRMDVDYIRKAQDQYRTLAAEADITDNSEAV